MSKLVWENKFIMDMPRVSIIINCLNGEKYLRAAIDSVYSQTYKNWDIIFWDNASIDSTAEIAKSYDSRLKYYCAKSTSDLGIARVKASEQATGELLAFLDCDDVWHEKKLTTQVNIFCKSTQDIGLVYGRSQIIYDADCVNNKVLYGGKKLPEGSVFAELTKNNFVTFSSVIVDRKKFFKCGGFPSHFKNSTDYWIFLRMAKYYKFAAMQEVCCSYRIHNSNLSASHKVLAVKESIETVSQFLPNKDALLGLRYQYLELALMNCKEGKIFLAISIILKKNISDLLVKWLWKRFRNYLNSI